jgi:hypothetical protein
MTEPLMMPDVAAMQAKVGEARERMREMGERMLAPLPVSAAAASVEKVAHTVTLDERLISNIEINVLRTQVAERDAELAKLHLKDALDRLAVLSVERDNLYAKVGERAGQRVIGNIRLVDREKGIVAVE